MLNEYFNRAEIVITPEFLSAEPFASNTIAVTSQGAVDFSKVSVILNNTVRILVYHRAH
jgi:hypothetical protein